MRRVLVAIVVAVFGWGMAAAVHAHGGSDDGVDYFVAIDGLETLATGTFAGMPNPNYGRLTLLVAHRSDENPAGNHFHAIGPYTVASIEGGPPTVLATSTNNRIPELSTGALPLKLHQGTGMQRRRLVSMTTEREYSNLKIASIQSLASADPGSADGILFRSSGGRWAGDLEGTRVQLQVISMTPGLGLADQRGREALRDGVRRLGSGSTLAFAPVYWTDRRAAPGHYAATLKLVDVRDDGPRAGDSGRFTFDFRVARPGDLDGDNDVDQDDLQLLEASLGDVATGPDDERDVNADGVVDDLDRRRLLWLLPRSSRR